MTVQTEYEKELSKREIKVNDKFILRGEIYKAVEGEGCDRCAFEKGCGMVPDCCASSTTVMVYYVKEEK